VGSAFLAIGRTSGLIVESLRRAIPGNQRRELERFSVTDVTYAHPDEHKIMPDKHLSKLF